MVMDHIVVVSRQDQLVSVMVVSLQDQLVSVMDIQGQLVVVDLLELKEDKPKDQQVLASGIHQHGIEIEHYLHHKM